MGIDDDTLSKMKVVYTEDILKIVAHSAVRYYGTEEGMEQARNAIDELKARMKAEAHGTDSLIVILTTMEITMEAFHQTGTFQKGATN